MEQPGDSVKEGRYRALIDEFIITHDKACDIYRQVAVTLHERSEREGKEYTSEQQHRIERSVVEVNLVDNPHRSPTKEVSDSSTYSHLHHKHQYGTTDADTIATTAKQIDKQDNKYIGHRVVRATLQLEQRSQILAQSLTAGTQNREYRSRVGRRYGRGQEQRQWERERNAQERRDKIDKTSEQECRHQYARRSEGYAFGKYGFYLRKFGIHTTRKEDDTERYHTDKLCQFGRVEREDVVTKEETYRQKEEKGGRIKTIRHLSRHYSDKEQNSSDKQEMLRIYIKHLS